NTNNSRTVKADDRGRALRLLQEGGHPRDRVGGEGLQTGRPGRPGRRRRLRAGPSPTGGDRWPAPGAPDPLSAERPHSPPATSGPIDQVTVQNRVAQAQPNRPADVNAYGFTTRKSTGCPILVINLFSPHNTYDSLFLANYANINVNDVLYRVPGVGQVRLFGS